MKYDFKTGRLIFEAIDMIKTKHRKAKEIKIINPVSDTRHSILSIKGSSRFSGFVKKALSAKLTRPVVYAVSVCVMTVLVCGSVAAADLQFAKQAVINGQPVGIINDVGHFEQLLTEVNSEMSQIIQEEAEHAPQPSYTTRLAFGADITNDAQLKQNILSTYDNVTKAFAIFVDGKAIAASRDLAAVNKALDELKAKYTPESGVNIQVEFAQNVEVKEVFVPVATLRSPLGLYSAITGVDVRTTYTVAYEAEIQPEQVVIDDSDSIQGRREVIHQGEPGKKNVTEQVVAVNGTVVEKVAVSENVLQPAVAEEIKIGTKKVAGIGTGTYIRPSYGTITSRYGNRGRGVHTGLDIANAVGTPIKAADEGKVTFSGWSGGYGNIVKLDHGNGIETCYAHCSEILVKEGQIVEKGEIIAKVGNTGNSTGPHLHFEVRVNDKPVNPELYVDYNN